MVRCLYNGYLCKIPEPVTGCYTRSFATVFGDLDGDGLLGKMVVLHPGTVETVPQLQRFKIPTLEISGLFFDTLDVLGPLPRPSPIQLAQYIGITSNGGLASPQSPVRVCKRFVDPSLVSPLLSSLPFI